MFFIGVVISLIARPAWAVFSPWEVLTDDSWIYHGEQPPDRLIMHTINAGDYEVGFDQRANNQSAKGMNTLKFSLGGTNTGHLISASPVGSVGIRNTGNARTFSDLLILVAIDANALPADFSMSLGIGGTVHQFDVNTDFGYYDHPEYDTGRPSGYYSLTSPSREDLTYEFNRGMVSVFVAPNANLGPAGLVSLNYAFANLPGPTIFSVYGLDSTIGWIYHTNRSVLDEHSPGEFVSTFKVVPEPHSLLLLLFGAGTFLRKR